MAHGPQGIGRGTGAHESEHNGKASTIHGHGIKTPEQERKRNANTNNDAWEHNRSTNTGTTMQEHEGTQTQETRMGTGKKRFTNLVVKENKVHNIVFVVKSLQPHVWGKRQEDKTSCPTADRRPALGEKKGKSHEISCWVLELGSLVEPNASETNHSRVQLMAVVTAKAWIGNPPDHAWVVGQSLGRFYPMSRSWGTNDGPQTKARGNNRTKTGLTVAHIDGRGITRSRFGVCSHSYDMKAGGAAGPKCSTRI
ncbi:hypothetical protein EV421DRAFT_2024100 [Armillaria borealis]|uniref:Uncharacterized protein n=1 Tax=Armillaria borealis TaxID=47425 RepID=A0AA39J003_9AGAR|nr:hypothetical protein EV421DRAFT_2024100 [Armillaria borealis]